MESSGSTSPLQARHSLTLPAALLALATSPLFLGCGEPAELPRLEPGTPVVLVIIDTLRADHLSCYGYELETSPALDRFARTAYVFDNNLTQCNSTLPSITSTLTGLYPRTHRNYIAVPIEGLVCSSDETLALPELLQRHGYYTTAIFSHPIWSEVPAAPGFSRGWDRFSVIPPEIMGAARQHSGIGALTNVRCFADLERWEKANATLPAGAPHRPLFLFAHYFDPHTDLEGNLYDPPPAYRNLYLRHHLASIGLERYCEDLEPLPPLERLRWMQHPDRASSCRDLMLASGRALYDAEIRSVDHQVERLFERLEELGLFEEALIVVMADHGENMELDQVHGPLAFSHARLFEGVARVPLMIRLPHQTEGARVDALTQSIDVMPTVLELLGLEPVGEPEGRSLVPLLLGSSTELHRMAFIESSDHVERAIKTDELKYVAPGNAKAPSLFRWRVDPLELEDVSAEAPAEVMEGFARSLAAFEPREALRLRFAPDRAPYRSAVTIELDTSHFEAVIGGTEHRLSEDRRRLELVANVADQPIEVVLATGKRNTRSSWSIAGIAAEDLDALAGRVYLGQLPISHSTATPLYRRLSEPAPAGASVRIETDDERSTFELVYAGEIEPLELELRFAQTAYGQTVELLEREGFGELEARLTGIFRLVSPPLARARALLRRSPPDVELQPLVRIDGSWPLFREVAWNGEGVGGDMLEFVFPWPLDARITALLLAGPGPEDPAPGSITIWIDTASGGELEIDPARLSPEQLRRLRALGYVK